MSVGELNKVNLLLAVKVHFYVDRFLGWRIVAFNFFLNVGPASSVGLFVCLFEKKIKKAKIHGRKKHKDSKNSLHTVNDAQRKNSERFVPVYILFHLK